MGSLLKEINGVRSVLRSPLPNSPSNQDITEALEETYQWATNTTNNTGNAWQIGTVNINAVEGVYVYQIETPFDDFYKALSVVTVPDANTSDPEFPLEFVEVEHIPQEWEWITTSGGRLYWSSHSAQYIAFYRKIGTTGETLWCEIRPVPDRTEYYKITYQVGEWFSRVGDTDFAMPHKEHRFHLRRLAAQTLLPKCRWNFGNNEQIKAEVRDTLDIAIARGAKAFDAHIAALDNADIVTLDLYADRYDLI